MQADLLHVIAIVSNPLRWQSRLRLFRQFAQHMIASGVQLTTVECALGNRPFEIPPMHGVNQVHVRHKTLCWHKESLINIGIQRLPVDAQYFAWIDADVEFRDPNWAAETVQMLQQYPVIQPWQHAYDLGPGGTHSRVDTSFASLVATGANVSPKWNKYDTFGHPGYAWAARRDALENMGGLFEAAVLGSADHHMAFAFLGRVRETAPGDMSAPYLAALDAWQVRALNAAGPHIGYLPATIEHQFHGPKALRNYVSRWDILRTNKYNPVTDIQKNLDGVTELTGDKPQLRIAIERYFASRNEDSNTA